MKHLNSRNLDEDIEQGMRCRALWKSLLLQLLEDSVAHLNATSRGDAAEALDCSYSYKKLTAWGRGMEELCDLAGVDLRSFKRIATIILDKHEEFVGKQLRAACIDKVLDINNTNSYTG
jgi:hypothetical protein